MKWIWDGGFTAHRLTHDGREVKAFTSSAQARQFVEKHEKVILAKRVNSPMSRNELRKKVRHKPIAKLTPDQQKLKDEALKMVKGLA